MLLIKKILLLIAGCAVFGGSWYGSYKLMWIINPPYVPRDPNPKTSNPPKVLSSSKSQTQ